MTLRFQKPGGTTFNPTETEADCGNCNEHAVNGKLEIEAGKSVRNCLSPARDDGGKTAPMLGAPKKKQGANCALF